MRKVLLISLAVILGLVCATDPTPLEKAKDALAKATKAAKTADDKYLAEAKAQKDVKEVKAADEAIKKVPALKDGATAEEKKKNAETLAPLNKALGEAVDTASKKTDYADKVKADEAVVKAQAAVDAFYCDAAKLDFPLFTAEGCAKDKAVTGDAQKLPKGFTDAVTEGLKDDAKSCVATGADKGAKSLKVTCEMADKKASITVASFSDDKCKTAVEDKAKKAVTATLAEGTCAANPATPTTWIKVGAKAGADGAAAADEGMGTGMIILIVVIVVVAIAALYFVKTKYFSGKGGE